MEEEEGGVVDEHASGQLDHQLSACRRKKRQGTLCLQRRVQGEVVQCRCEKVASDGKGVWVIISADSQVADRNASELLDHGKVHQEQRCDVCQAFSYAILGPLELRNRLVALGPVLQIGQAQLWIMDKLIDV